MGLKAKACVEGCGWCCRNVNMPVPTNELFTLERMLELLLLQGHKIYQEPSSKDWYVIIESPCAHYDIETRKCRIYHLLEARAYLCRNWTCHDPGNMLEYYDFLTIKGEKDAKDLL